MKENYDKFHFATPCGAVCDLCPYLNSEKEITCKSCLKTIGSAFWGECEVYKCAEKHQVEHCGLCEEFPCSLAINHYDTDNPKGPQNAVFRIGQCAIRKKLGTEEWLKQRKEGKLPKGD